MSDGPYRIFYLIAVGGTAMTPLASLLVEKGETVLGSDLLPLYPPMSDRIASLGIEVRAGFDARNLPERVDRVVVGNLAGKDNPELVEAMRRSLPTASMPRTLHDEFLVGRHPVVVAGTHGKTTTTAMTAWILHSAGREPGWLVGGEPAGLPGPSGLGAGPAFVVEGDEYSTSWEDKGPKFLHYAPRTFLLTSVEFDHADLYADLAAVKEAFRQGVALVPRDGLVVACGEDGNVREVAASAKAPVLFYGIEGAGTGAGTAAGPCGLLARDLVLGEDGARFIVEENGRPLLSAATRLAGRHNVLNALAAVGASRAQGLSGEEIAAGLASFGGVKRRMEERGTAAGVLVVDDFGHHPTAVRTTLDGARRRYPGRRIWAVLEPRSITAGRADLFEAWQFALEGAGGIAVARPFHAERLSRPGGPGALDTAALAAALDRPGRPALTASGPDPLRAALLPLLAPGDVVVVMSSGGFGGFCGALLDSLR